MEKLKKLILIETDEINKLKKNKYNVLYTDEYYLKMILYILNDINN
jgi:hypothetical protein